jgi:peptide deformylase
MAVLPIRLWGDPILKKRAVSVDRITHAERKLIEDMIDTMDAADGAGLAAPQVGVSKRIFVFRRGSDVHAIINPRIVSRSSEQKIGSEGCLSIPGAQAKVSRAARVTVTGRDEKNKVVSLSCEDNDEQGRAATCVQHELDHLDGVLYLEKAEPESVSWLIEGEDEDGEETVFLDPTTPAEILAAIKSKQLPSDLHVPEVLRRRVEGRR